MTSLRPRLAPLLLVLGLVAACGDDEDGSSTSTTEASGTGGGGAGPTTTASTGAAGGGGSGGEGGGGSSAGIGIPGLEGAVTVTVDEHGVHHVACAADDDCFAALGWIHAQNRFFFMDFVRNLVRGSLGGLVKAGPIVLEQDYANRRFFTTREGEPLEDALYDQASDRVKGHLDAYTRGVNAWIADMRAGRNGATLTTEYDFNLIEKGAIRDWEPADSAAVGLYVMNDLSNNSAAELQAAAIAPAFDPALAADLFSTDSVFDAFTAPPPPPPPVGLPVGSDPFARFEGARSLLADAAVQARDLAGGRHKVPGESGSNDWVVAPERSATGNALVANDPHLLLTNPSIWFPAEIDAKSGGDGDYHMAGGTFPGLPAVMIGHNESIAWGVTTVYWDLADVYVEELTADGAAVVFEGDEVPILEKEYEFADLASGQTQTRTFRWVPHHGPIVEEDLDAGTAITIRWRGHDGGQDLDAFFAVGRAGSVDEARAGLAEHATSANQNFVIADVEGNIGWFPYSRVPSRPWASLELPPWLPLPGDGSAEWGDPVPMDELPQLLNPEEGVIATANQDLTGAGADGDPTNDGQDALQTRVKGDGTREQRILDLLQAGGDEHTVETMVAMQGDTFSLYGELVTPLLLEAAEDMTLGADEQALVDALAGWDYTCPTGLATSDPEGDGSDDAAETAASIGCTAFHIAWLGLVEEAMRDDVEAAGLAYGTDVTGASLVARAFTQPEQLVTSEALWDDVTTEPVETRLDIAARAVSTAGRVFGALGGDDDDRRWGRVHTLTLRSIYDNFGVTTYNDGPHAAPGGLNTVNVANPAIRPLPESGGIAFPFAAGPSIRLVSEVTADGPRMVFQLPGGADLHRDSDFYNNLLPRWLDDEPVDFAFGPGAVEEPYATIEVLPAD
jgi:penicillin amidase